MKTPEEIAIEKLCHYIESTYNLPVNEGVDKVARSREIASLSQQVIDRLAQGAGHCFSEIESFDLITLLVEVRDKHQKEGGLL